MLSSRDGKKEELQKWKAGNVQGKTGSFAEAATFGDLLVLATGGSVTLDAISLAGVKHFSNKLVIDATNPISKEVPKDGVLNFFTDHQQSLIEKIQLALPDAKIVKAFNSVGNALMYKPDFKGTKPTMFICGNDGGAKLTVTNILYKFGWETADMGTATAGRAIEPLCILWCIPGFIRNEWGNAFKLLKP